MCFDDYTILLDIYIYIFFSIYLFTCLCQVLVAAQGIFAHRCCVQDL